MLDCGGVGGGLVVLVVVGDWPNSIGWTQIWLMFWLTHSKQRVESLGLGESFGSDESRGERLGKGRDRRMKVEVREKN